MSKVTEWKTIRVNAVEYYKLVELSGMFTSLFGAKVAISTLANIAIEMCHEELYDLVKKHLQDEEKILKIREDFRENRKKNARLKLDAKQLTADLKKIK